VERAIARASDGAFAVDGSGTIVMWNQAAARITGYSAGEAVGQSSRQLFATGERDRCLCEGRCDQPAGAGESLQTLDVETRTKAGAPVSLNVNVLALPAFDQRGSLKVHLVREVTTLKEFLRLAEAPADQSPPSSGAEALTPREREVLQLLAIGTSTRAAAERLHVSPSTIRNHVQNLLDKLGVHSRLEAVAYANCKRLI